MNLTPNMKLLLAAILADMQRLEAAPEPSAMDRGGRRSRYLGRREYIEHGVRHDLERWLGYPPTRSDSAVFSRMLRHMEDMGLLVRVNRWGLGSRTTHVRLTSLGRAVAERLCGLDPSQADGGVDAKPPDIDGVDYTGTFEGFAIDEPVEGIP